MRTSTLIAIVLAILSFVFIPSVCMAWPSRSSSSQDSKYKPSKSLVSSIWSNDDDRPSPKKKKSSKSKGKKSSSKKSSSSKSRSRK